MTLTTPNPDFKVTPTFDAKYLFKNTFSNDSLLKAKRYDIKNVISDGL